ncbi:MAG: D-alanyl-D-alanine carboxypeptidase/D-alanyl-D-alanine endopeptidase [Elusimicrobiales bacterium]
MKFIILISSFLLSSDDCSYFDSKFKQEFAYSFSVYDLKESKIVKSCKKDMLLIPASSLKVVTSLYAFENLGSDYRFKTEIALSKNTKNHRLVIKGCGDFTLGSENFSSSIDSVTLRIYEVIKERNIKKLEGVYVVNGYISFPDGSVEWQDLGNYYATTVSLFSINDNSYKIHFRTFDTEKPAVITKIVPHPGLHFINMVVAGSSFSGDNAYIKANPYSPNAVIIGDLPAMKDDFVIKGAVFHPDSFFADFICKYFKELGVEVGGCYSVDRYDDDYEVVDTIYSPPLSKIVSFMNEKSFNLYAESLLHFAMIKSGVIGYERNIEELSSFLKKIGVEKFYIRDGSGLSRRNLFTADGFVKILDYAYHSNYFESFYLSLPSSERFKINGADELRFKSGSMNRIRSWCGYIRRDQKIYAFSFIFNNYLSQPSEIESAVVEYLEEIIQGV